MCKEPNEKGLRHRNLSRCAPGEDKPRTRVVVKLRGAVVYGVSVKQALAAPSSCEAAFVAAVT
eukprot:11321178-Prorocentrum_lima.AAC.1